MDSNLKETSSDVQPVVSTSKASVAIPSLPTNNVASAEVGTSQTVVSVPNLPKKHIIRKIIHLDPKKLQQAGLDRKIAEALSKQKSRQQSNNQPNHSINALPSHFSQIRTADTKNLIVSKTTSKPASAKNIDNKTVINKLNPPKITITGPEAPTEKDKQNLANLNSQQRLVHVKNLLNKKLLEKKSKETTDNSKTNQLLKTPQAIGDRKQQMLHTKVTKEKPPPKNLYAVLKEPARIDSPSLNNQSHIKLQTKPPKDMTSVNVLNHSIRAPKPPKTNTPQKSPQDIARKLVFQTDTPQSKVSAEGTEKINFKRSVDEEFPNCLNKDVDVIPKASIMSVNIQQQYKKPKQHAKKWKQIVEEVPASHSLLMIKKTKEPQNFETVYMKHEKIVKEPTITSNAVITQMQLPKLQKIDFPEVSPLKEPFPTANVPKETPLPAIDSFKKPYALTNTVYYNLDQKPAHPTDYTLTNYENSLFSQPTSSLESANSNKTAAATNCLVVLENKILSQDEMIDLTELRLSSNTPRFIHPHRPIPEVVIKQEHPDDYQSTETDTFSLANSFAQTTSAISITQGIKSHNNERQQAANLPIFNKQKKFIINAEKLQLPPEQLAELARKIKEKTATKPKETQQVVGKYQDTANVDSKVSRKSPTFMLSHKPEMAAQTPNVKPQDFILPHNQMYGNFYNHDHDYYDGQNYLLSLQSNADSINKSLIQPAIQSSSVGPQLYNYYDNSPVTTAKFDTAKNSLSFQAYDKSAVEIIDEPIETDDSFSAVDFIATLGNTTAELTLEELNLNASCNFNQSFPPVKINASPQKTMSPIIQTNANTNLLRSTIVIESSKGQETIVTNEDKNDLEKVKEKIKIYHEMNKQKSANKSIKLENRNKFQHVTYTDDGQSRDGNQSNLYDNTNVCKMDLEETSHDQWFYIPEKREERKQSSNYTQNPMTAIDPATPRRRESFGKAPIISKTTANTSIIEESGSALGSTFQPPKDIDLANGKVTKGRLETLATTNSILNAENVCTDLITPKEANGNQHLETQSQTDKSVSRIAEENLETLPSRAPKQEISEATIELNKLIPESEISKCNATISNTAVATKRISKFKKGKINLVPRNKPLSVLEKTSADEKNFVNKTPDEIQTECEKKMYLELRDKSLPSYKENANKINNDKDEKSNVTESPVENKTVCILEPEQNQIKPSQGQHIVEGSEAESSELTAHSDQSQRTEEAKKQNQTPKKETSQDLTTEKPQNVLLALKSQGTDQNLEMFTYKHIIDIPEVSTKTFKDLTEPVQSSPNLVETSVTAPKKVDNAEEKINTAQADEKIVKEEKSRTENSFQENLNHKNIKNPDAVQKVPPFQNTPQPISKDASKGEDTEVGQSPKNNMDCGQPSLKSPKVETHQVKEILEQNIQQDSESTKNVSQNFSAKALINSMEKSQESKAEKANLTFTKNLKVTSEVSTPITETQCEKSLVFAKVEKEEQNAFGLPKAITGRMKVLKEPQKTTKVSEILKRTDVVKGNIEDTNLKSFKATDNEQSKHFVGIEKLDSGLKDGRDDTKTFQPKMGIPKTSLKFDKRVQQCSTTSSESKDAQNHEKPLKIPKTDESKALEPNPVTVEHLNQHSQAMLQTMKSAKISLIDVVRHSTIEHTNKPPILPFKKSLSDTKHSVTNVSGITTLLNQLKKDHRSGTEEEATFKETKKPGRETRTSMTNKKEQKTSKCSRRASLRTGESLTSPLPPKITRKRLSLRPLISDDDLEFLPENAEVKFNLTKSKQKEYNRKSSTETRRESLYTRSHTKRNRYYSQTLETDVTITFENLKTIPNLTKNMATEESCHDSTQDSNFATPSKQRKKLRKTMEDIKKSQKAVSDTESEDFQRDYECLVKDCEESNAFLGFEETPVISSSFESLQHATSDAELESKTKHGGLKNWLTTGKAISPTLDNAAASRKRLRQYNVSPAASTSTSTKQQIHLKKRWDLCCEETDITDDTSPADDEEEINKQIPLRDKLNRDIKNVIDSNKNSVDSKKIKLNEDSFKPDIGDTERFKEEAEESQQLNRKNLDENLAKISKSACKSTENNSTNSKNATEISTKEHSINTSEDGSDNGSKELKQTKSKQTKQTAKYSKKEIKNMDRDASRKNVASKASQDIKLIKEQHSENGKEANLICTSDIEIKQVDSKNLSDSQNKTFNKLESCKSKRGKKSKANAADNKSSTVQETSSKKTEKIITKAQNSTISEVEKICSTPEHSASSKRKRGKTDESPLQPKKKHCLKIIEDPDRTSLLTPLEITNSSPMPHLSAKECDSKSLEMPLDKTLEADNSMDNPKPIGKRGRQKNPNNDSNFKSRLLLITKREQLDSDEVLTETSPGSGSIQCGLCLTRTEPLHWASHLAQHYGVGWQVGEQKLNIDNRTVILNTIKNYVKKYKCSGLACRMCQKVLRSALGIITHIEQCGHQERGNCEFCNKNYSKNFLVLHVRSCRARCDLETETNVKEIKSENIDAPDKIVGNTGRFKRHSTIKAENKLKVLGKELENLGDLEKPEVDPKLHIKYVPSPELNFAEKWSKQIADAAQASCPKAICRFTSSDINELAEHVKTCKHMKSGYICNFCRKAFKTEQKAIDHIIANHQKGRARRKSEDSDCDVKIDVESSSDNTELSEDEIETTDNSGNEVDDLMDESPKKGKNKKKVATKLTRYYRSSIVENRKEVFGGRCKDLDNKVLQKWNRFTKQNYSREPRYTEFLPQYSVLNRLDYERYLPTQSVSMKFNLTNKNKLIETVGLPETDIKWSELKRFETLNDKSHTYCFLGAPIKMCAWLPLPADVSEQFLAVIFRQDMFKYIKFSQPKQHHSIVLVFKVTQKNKVPELSIHYGFVVNDGPIHHLSFLPSGGYDESTNRLGLVAVATVTSCIKIYSLPLNVDLATKPASTDNCSTVDHIVLIDVKPSFLLNLDISHQCHGDKQQEGLQNSQCIKTCWSEFSEHQHIFAGFSNGFVGIWNIQNDAQQNLNRFVIDDVVNYAPLNYFYLGEKSVKCLALHYDTLGPRWLVACTAYRRLIVFDIKNLMNPVVYKEEIVKNILSSIDWCPVWETFLMSYDDTLPSIGNGILTVNPANLMFQHNKLNSAITGVSQIHYTPVANMCVTALNNGDIEFLDTKELHYDNCLNKKKFGRRALYALDVKRLDGEPLGRLPMGNKSNDNVEIPSDWVMHDYNYKEKYGLIFTPLLKLDEKLKKAYVSEKRTPPPNMIPFMRINTLRCNINQQGEHLVAAGYENGFLRLVYFEKRKVFSP